MGEEEKPKTLETGSGSNIPDIEGFPKPRIDEYLENRGIKDTKEQYKDIKDSEKVYKAKTKLENWRKEPEAKDILILSLQGHKPSEWKRIFSKWEGNLIRHSMEALNTITDYKYKLVYS